MAERVRWRRRFPSRALRRFGWSAAAGGVVAAVAWLLFGAEPGELGSGEANPLALVPPATTVLVLVTAAGAVAAVFRRPSVHADHYALTVRPGALRRLTLPWAEVAEIAGRTAVGGPLLLVRCRDSARSRPRWLDQGVLRRAGRRAAAGYHLAVRLDEFAGPPAERLADLAAWAPPQVRLVDELS